MDSHKQEMIDKKNALLSMDKETIQAHFKKYSNDTTDDDLTDEEFWISVHIMRNVTTSLPVDERRKSALWLREHGYKSYSI